MEGYMYCKLRHWGFSEVEIVQVCYRLIDRFPDMVATILAWFREPTTNRKEN